VLAALDWSTIGSLSTGVGTLVLAAATFSSVRSGNRAARTAERALAVTMRPVLASSRLDDAEQKVMWVDHHSVNVEGAGAVVEVVDDVVYLAASVRNVGSGIAVLRSWFAEVAPDEPFAEHTDLDRFRRLTRDLYIPPGDIGFWQGVIRDRDDPGYEALVAAAVDRLPVVVEILYGDLEGGQRAVSRFACTPIESTTGWHCWVTRHWSIDGPDPR
jgi:hypothetical protein